MIGAAAEILQDDQVEILVRNAGRAEHGALGQCEVLAIAAAARQSVRRRHPAIGDAELNLVVDEADARVDVAVDRFELGDDAFIAKRSSNRRRPMPPTAAPATRFHRASSGLRPIDRATLLKTSGRLLRHRFAHVIG